MKTLKLITTALVGSMLLAGCQQATLDHNQSFIDKSADWEKAFNEADKALGTSQYTEDAMLMAPNAPSMVGHEAISGMFMGAEAFGASVSLNTVESFSSGQLGYARGEYTFTAPDGTVVDKGKYIELHKKVGDKWLMHRDIFNSDLPAATGADNSAAEAALAGYITAWNSGDLDTLGEFFTADISRTTPGNTSNSSNIDELHAVMAGFQAAYPDANVDVHDTWYNGDVATLSWTFSGTNTGPGEIPPTGNSVSISGLSKLTFTDGKISEEVVVYDNLDFMQQLGYTLSAPE
jgi:steroid delta-isomerase-like uncharacterized protein